MDIWTNERMLIILALLYSESNEKFTKIYVRFVF